VECPNVSLFYHISSIISCPKQYKIGKTHVRQLNHRFVCSTDTAAATVHPPQGAAASKRQKVSSFGLIATILTETEVMFVTIRLR
jgi:hypothetical protein